ncbi:MAG: flagellar biosynthesis anti-sigma factor FlgM [Anaerohalosphaeraceae bacterium]|nr:flagellar biosynthesis anti-sigma factor FlgM [Anaerohalosphaeraceae bacterium]
MNNTEINFIGKYELAQCNSRIKSKMSMTKDLQAEEMLAENAENPIGRLLGKIAEMPEVRQEKVLSLRRELSQGSYNLNNRLDVTLDRLLEELIF